MGVMSDWTNFDTLWPIQWIVPCHYLWWGEVHFNVRTPVFPYLFFSGIYFLTGRDFLSCFRNIIWHVPEMCYSLETCDMFFTVCCKSTYPSLGWRRSNWILAVAHVDLKSGSSWGLEYLKDSAWTSFELWLIFLGTINRHNYDVHLSSSSVEGHIKQVLQLK